MQSVWATLIPWSAYLVLYLAEAGVHLIKIYFINIAGANN
jgi:hypothetical protein